MVTGPPYGIYTTNIHVRLEPTTRDKLDQWAKANKMQRAEAIRAIIEHELETFRDPA